MRVRNATGWGFLAGVILGAIALGYIKVDPETQQSVYTFAWWAVVITTLFPLVSYLQERELLIGVEGGFVSGLGTGLGFFLLLAGRVF